jgi:7,8-dihydropterin-6-yl-methyl-4-(beta-D-ribofuranosyl)aminobenzene 5'-phosphate synthase
LGGGKKRMALRITTLSENTARLGDFLGEWGLSVLVEMDETTVLFDAGKGFSTAHNADSLGIDLSKIDKIVLSHGHYDHTGGLREVLRKMKKQVEIIAHPDIWQAKYARRKGEPDRYIGIPFQRDELENLGASFHLTADAVTITKYIITTGVIPMVTDFEQIGEAFFVRGEGGWQPDKLADDQALIIKAEQGLVVVLGCAHRGMINTLYHAQRLASISEIHTLIGGSHLIGASEERLWKSIAALKELDVQKLALCHCTDLPAISVLAQEFGNRFLFNKAGTVIKFA